MSFMKKQLLLFILFLLSVSIRAQLKMPTAKVNGNLNDYKYYYVVPTEGITASSGVSGTVTNFHTGITVGNATRTVVPSDIIKGFLMKRNFNVITSIKPELANQTLIVSYGYIGRRPLKISAYASVIVLQLINAKTQELVASFEAEGCGADETDDILQAVDEALRMFQYCAYPIVLADVLDTPKKSVILSIFNHTPNILHHVTLRMGYFLAGELMYEQESTLKITLYPGVKKEISIKRDKPAREKYYTVKINVVSYD